MAKDVYRDYQKTQAVEKILQIFTKFNEDECVEILDDVIALTTIELSQLEGGND